MQGKTINGFELKRQLGVGGMAEVWYAENKIGKKAAVKMLLPKLCEDTNIVERFLTEAKVTVGLSHPNIRQVYDYGEIDGRPAIVQEYLDGDDLKALMKSGKTFTGTELEKWWNQLVDALCYTHGKGVVHRDIKPANIFVDTDGNIKLLDFGIAKLRDSISKTQTGQKIGTLMYMSPEQVKDSKRIDYRTDVYSLAVTFVHLLTGRKPYDSDTSSDFEISENIVYKPIDMTGVPDKWRNFLLPYLAKNLEDRPALKHFGENVAAGGRSAASPNVQANLASSDGDETCADTPAIPAKPKPVNQAPKPQRPEPDRRKNRNGLWIGLGLGVVAVILAIVLWPKSQTSIEQPDDVVQSDDDIAFEACTAVADYRAYIRDYGHNAAHYSEANDYVEKHIADSTKDVEQKKADDEAARKAAAEAQKKAGKGALNGHDWIDLGLSVRWATCNVGATSPESYGNYYAWSETKTKSAYSWNTYKYCNGGYNTLTKYCNSSEYGNGGFSDNLTKLQRADDAAANWGSGWRMPTKAEFEELIVKCSWNWTGKGYKVTGPNGNSIFLPAAGGRYDSELYYAGSYGYYWSSSLYTDSPDAAWYLYFDSDNYSMYDYNRYYGLTVRPVCVSAQN